MWGVETLNVICYRGNKLHHAEKAERKPRMYQWRLLKLPYFFTASKMTSRPSVLARTLDSKNLDPYYCIRVWEAGRVRVNPVLWTLLYRLASNKKFRNAHHPTTDKKLFRNFNVEK